MEKCSVCRRRYDESLHRFECDDERSLICLSCLRKSKSEYDYPECPHSPRPIGRQIYPFESWKETWQDAVAPCYGELMPWKRLKIDKEHAITSPCDQQDAVDEWLNLTDSECAEAVGDHGLSFFDDLPDVRRTYAVYVALVASSTVDDKDVESVLARVPRKMRTASFFTDVLAINNSTSKRRIGIIPPTEMATFQFFQEAVYKHPSISCVAAAYGYDLGEIWREIFEKDRRRMRDWCKYDAPSFYKYTDGVDWMPLITKHPELIVQLSDCVDNIVDSDFCIAAICASPCVVTHVPRVEGFRSMWSSTEYWYAVAAAREPKVLSFLDANILTESFYKECMSCEMHIRDVPLHMRTIEVICAFATCHDEIPYEYIPDHVEPCKVYEKCSYYLGKKRLPHVVANMPTEWILSMDVYNAIIRSAHRHDGGIRDDILRAAFSRMIAHCNELREEHNA